MDIVVRRGRATATEVLGDLPDPPTNSSVRSMLRLLEEKGYLRHDWEGPRYVYVATADPEQLRRSAASHVLQTFFGNSVESAVTAMLDAAEHPPSEEELKRMAKVIDQARRKRVRR